MVLACHFRNENYRGLRQGLKQAIRNLVVGECGGVVYSASDSAAYIFLYSL